MNEFFRGTLFLRVSAAASLLMATCLFAGEIIVDPGGSGDTLSIQEAADAASAGDLVRIRAGVYEESLNLTKSGTAEAPIVFRPFGDGEVVIDGVEGLYEACIFAKGVRYVQIENLTLRGASIAGFYAEGPSDHLVLDSLTIEDIYHPLRGAGYGIFIYALPDAVTDCEITGCKIRNTSSHGIILYGRNLRYRIHDCHISYSGMMVEGLQDNPWGHSIKTVVWNEDGPENGPSDILIENNELEHAWTQGIMTWNARNVIIRQNHIHHSGATGIQIEDGTTFFIVEDNLSEWNQQHYNTETGIWVDDASNGVVRNNILRRNQVGIKISKCDHVIVRHNLILNSTRSNDQFQENGGIFLLAYYGIDNSNAIIVHNTVADMGSEGYFNAGLLLVEYDVARVTGTFFKNNILSGVVDGHEIITSTDDLTSNFNTIFNPYGSRVEWLGHDLTWEDYLRISGEDASSISLDPLYVDSANGNYNLHSNSPCIDRGTPLTWTSTAGSGSEMQVDDARPFTDGWGLVPGDFIMVGRDYARVVAVDYIEQVLTLDRALTWLKGEGVTFPFTGLSPDMGAVEMRGHKRPFDGP